MGFCAKSVCIFCVHFQNNVSLQRPPPPFPPVLGPAPLPPPANATPPAPLPRGLPHRLPHVTRLGWKRVGNRPLGNALGETAWQPSALVLPHRVGNRPLRNALGETVWQPSALVLPHPAWQPSQRLRCHTALGAGLWKMPSANARGSRCLVTAGYGKTGWGCGSRWADAPSPQAAACSGCCRRCRVIPQW